MGVSRQMVYIINHPGSRGSHNGHTLVLLNAMAQRGWRIVVIVEHSTPSERAELRDGSVQYRFLRLPSILRLLELAGRLVYYRMRGYRTVFTRISTRAAAVAGLLGRLVGYHSYFWYSTQGAIEAREQLPPLRRIWYSVTRLWPLHAAVRLSSWLVTGPSTMARYYAEELRLCAGEKILILSNDIDVDTYVAQTHELKHKSRVELGLAADCVVAVAVQRLSPIRRVGDYLAELARLGSIGEARPGQPLLIVVVGGGPQLDALATQYGGSSLSDSGIIFVGAVSRERVRTYLLAADVFLMPSYAEGFPRVLLEAMATALPIVSTDAGGAKEILGSDNCALVLPRDDPDSFARAVYEMACRPERELQEIGRGLRSRVEEHYATVRVAAAYERLLLSHRSKSVTHP